MKNKTLCKKSIAFVLTLAISLASFTIFSGRTTVLAAANPYSMDYNIVDGVNYAVRWVNDSNPDYKHINKWAKNNCASFVSETLTASGVKIDQAYRQRKGLHYKYYNQQWSVANEQYKYLKKQGYACEEANNENIHVGDVVYYDWNDGNSKSIDHAAYCIGVNKNNVPVIAEHNPDQVRVWNATKTKAIRKAFVIHMTNAVGLVDVTNQYVDKPIYVKSLKNNCYVSSDTDDSSATDTIAIANRESTGYWEKFQVIENPSVASSAGTTYPISLRTNTGRYLSAFITEENAPMKNTNNNSTWEAIRIYHSGNAEFILSMINGKFVHVRDDNNLYAAGEGGWSWESFHISTGYGYTVNPNVQNNSRFFPKCEPSYIGIVSALQSLGVDSSFSYRSKIALANGILNYTGTAYQNTLLLDKLKAGTLINPSSSTSIAYFPRCESSYHGIVSALQSIGVDSSFGYRAKIAVANGITDYSGTAEQNTTMLNMLKDGILIKP